MQDHREPGRLLPFFEGSLSQVKELQTLCAEHGVDTIPVEPPGGCSSG